MRPEDAVRNCRWARDLDRACEALNALVGEVRRRHPHAMLYLSDGALNLMWAASHGNEDGSGNTVAHPERVLAAAKLYADGGGW